jgi:hypothetical protein
MYKVFDAALSLSNIALALTKVLQFAYSNNVATLWIISVLNGICAIMLTHHHPPCGTSTVWSSKQYIALIQCGSLLLTLTRLVL